MLGIFSVGILKIGRCEVGRPAGKSVLLFRPLCESQSTQVLSSMGPGALDGAYGRNARDFGGHLRRRNAREVFFTWDELPQFHRSQSMNIQW